MKKNAFYHQKFRGGMISGGLLCIIFLLLQCTTNQIAGTGSSTGNAKILGLILENNGAGASHTIVSLIPDGYNPVKDNEIPFIQFDTTDAQGRYQFMKADSGLYNLHAENIISKNQLLSTGILIEKTTSITRVDTLEEAGTIKVVFQDTLSIGSGYIIIPGTTISVKINSVLIKVGTEYQLTIGQVPADAYDGLFFVKDQEQEIPLRLSLSFAVEPGDTTVVPCYRMSTVLNEWNSGLPDNDIYAIAADLDGSRWFGGYLGMIGHMTGDHWTVFDIHELGISSSILYIAIDSTRTKWFGTSGLVLTLSDNSFFRVYDLSMLFQAPVTKVYDIQVASNDVKWIGTFGAGLVRYDNALWSAFTVTNSGIPSNNVSALAINPGDHPWIGTNRGIAKFDGTKWTVFNKANSSLPCDTVWGMAYDYKKGVLWIGTARGDVVCYTGCTWTVYNAANSKIPRSTVHSIAVDKRGHIWCGTASGAVLEFDGKTWSLFNYQNSHLPQVPGAIYSIVIDEYDNKWISTENGGVAVFGLFPSGPK